MPTIPTKHERAPAPAPLRITWREEPDYTALARVVLQVLRREAPEKVQQRRAS